MNKTTTLVLGLLLSSAALFSQRINNSSQPAIGTPGWASSHRSASYQIHTLNGSDTLTTLYQNTACGLNYCQATVRLGQRPNVNGVPQPAPLTIGNLTACTTVLKAYLYTEILDTISTVTASLTDPNHVTSPVPMMNIGNSIDVCWGMNGTHVWRADVTSLITGNGTYMINNVPVSTTITNPDAEGVTLLIIYQDPTANWEGTLRIDDGCHTVVGVPVAHTMNGLTPCSNSIYGRAFTLMGDIQLNGFTATFNGNPSFPVAPLWWNYIEDANVNISSSQTSTTCSFVNASDCYTLAVAGLYYRTQCMTCTPMSSTLSLTTSSTNNSCNGNGTASVSVTGNVGPLTYFWFPGGQTTATATGLQGGTYTVNVSDGTSCSSATVVVNSTAPALSMTSTNAGCSTGGSATVSVTGGQSPFTYSWAPSGGNVATASNLSAGTYTVTVTDNNGCTLSDTAVVGNSTPITAIPFSTPVLCANQMGTANVWAYGGTAPYTYSWMPGNLTTDTITGLSAGTYTVTVTDHNGCTVTVTDTVAAGSPAVTAGSTALLTCGDSTSLYASTSMNVTSYSWTPVSSLTGANTSMPTATPTITTTYTVTVTGSCGTYSDTVTIFVDTVNYNTQSICFVTVDTSVNKNIIIWDRSFLSLYHGFFNIYKETAIPGVYALLATQPIQAFSTYTDMTSNPNVSADRYEISTLDTCGHESALSAHHRTLFLQTFPVTSGDSLVWNAYEGIAVTSYNIYRGPALNQLTLLTTVGSTNYTDPNPPVGSVYMVEAVNPNGPCSPSRRQTESTIHSNLSEHYSPLGIAENEIIKNSLVIAPNPGSGMFHLNYKLGSASTVRISIIDALGRVVYEGQDDRQAGPASQDLNLENLADGVYSLRLMTTKASLTSKLVVQRNR